MKIAMVGPYPLDDKIQSGIGMHILNLSHYLSKFEEVDLHVVTLGDSYSHIESENFTISIIKHSHFPPLDIYRLKQRINKIDPDIIHCQGTYFPYSTAAAILSKKYNAILTVHGLISHEIKYMGIQDSLESIFVGLPLEKYALSRIHNIIICSPAMSQLLNVDPESTVSLIPNGVNIPKIVNNIKAHTKALKKPSILFVGNLEKIKGVDLLIRAVHELITAECEVYLYVVGDGPQKSYLEKLCRELDIKENVKFLGFRDHKEKNFFYRNTDIFVLPSRYESFGIVILEAMSFGKPVIASNVGGIPYMISDHENGLLFENQNFRDLSKKIFYLLNNRKARLNMGFKAQDTAKSYDWGVIAHKTLNLYQEII